jgi:dipeptidyl aminopeptidase/acylaminoacyl peptidase
MALPAGSALGPYEIVATIGAGGMGEVYRARDKRLNRDVAIKVLPPLFASDPDRRARFEREAQAVAALSHPNILAIFDVGIHDGIAYAVTELLTGETLRERLASGPLPPRKVIDCAVQIARGLAAAHDQGLVHRDLKPEHIFLVTGGHVKLLDFGLARPIVSGTSLTVSGSTDPGTVMGTAGYMAPEQVRGHAVDQRTDLFAFGAVLYEMLSGRRAFHRDTAAETMAAILNEDPPEIGDGGRPWLLPRGLERIVRHCLEKHPAERFQSARDVAFAIDTVSGSSSQPLPAASAVRRRWVWPAIGAALLVIAAPLSFIGGRRTAAPAARDVTLAPRTFDEAFIPNARFLPDGQGLVFSAVAEQAEPELFVSRPNITTPQRVGQVPAHLLSVSRTGELAVLLNPRFIFHRLYVGTLARMTLDGAPRRLMDDVREADWAPDGATLAIVRTVEDKDRLEFPMGHVLYETGGYVSDPRVAPDGKRVAFFEHQGRFDDRGWLKIVDGNGVVATLTSEYSALQGLAWSLSADAMAFSAVRGSSGVFEPRVVSVSPRPTDRQLLPNTDSLLVQDVARDGRVLAVRMQSRHVMRARAAGTTAERDVSWLNAGVLPRLSADGKLVAFTDQSESTTYSVAYRTIEGGPVAKLGEGTVFGFSPDGKWVLASPASVIGPATRLVIYPTGPGNALQPDRGSLTTYTVASWFPDSRRILTCGGGESEPPRCYQQPIAGGAPAAITPPGYKGAWVAPDSHTLSLVRTDGTWHRGSVGGSDIRPLATLTEADSFLGWASDSSGIFVGGSASNVARIDRVDISSGARTRVREIRVSEPGVVLVWPTDYRSNGAYAYMYWKQPSTVFEIGGLDVR